MYRCVVRAAGDHFYPLDHTAAAVPQMSQTMRIIPLGMILLSRYISLALKGSGVGLDCEPSLNYYIVMECAIVRRTARTQRQTMQTRVTPCCSLECDRQR